MACLKPMTCWYDKDVNPKTGKRGIVFDENKAQEWAHPLKIACGQCLGCRIDKAKGWGIRAVHESSLYDNNTFVTFTYNTESLEKRDNPWSIDYKEIQQLHKNMRKKYGPFRFMLCGEYGEKYHRPHYHGIYFGLDFADKELFTNNKGHPLYMSPSLERAWGKGGCLIGNLTFESAAYVARYSTKKLLGKKAEPDTCPDETGQFTLNNHYSWMDEETGEIRPRTPETLQMSRGPGLAKDWFLKNYKEIYPRDECIINGKTMKPPKYYDKLMQEIDYDLWDTVRNKRLEQAQLQEDNDTDDWLRKMQIEQAKLAQLEGLTQRSNC